MWSIIFPFPAAQAELFPVSELRLSLDRANAGSSVVGRRGYGARQPLLRRTFRPRLQLSGGSYDPSAQHFDFLSLRTSGAIQSCSTMRRTNLNLCASHLPCSVSSSTDVFQSFLVRRRRPHPSQRHPWLRQPVPASRALSSLARSARMATIYGECAMAGCKFCVPRRT